MVMDLQKAKDILRLDNDYNDDLVLALLESIPSYIETTTGLTRLQQYDEPLTDTVGGFLLMLWFNAEDTNSEQLTRTIDSLLKTLSYVKKRENNAGNQ